MNKNYYKYIVYVCLAAILPLINACGGATEFEEDAEHKKPIKNTLQLGIVGFKKAISEIEPSTIIGGFYTGWAKVLRQEYYASGFIDEKFQRTYEDVIITELNKAGYETISKNVIFDTTTVSPRFLLGAALTDGRLNYYKSVTENNADALVDIRWELYDTKEKKIIYSKKELGTYRDAESDLFAYREAVRVSFRNFLADKKLVESIKKHIELYPIN